jgi:hypothetical protein
MSASALAPTIALFGGTAYPVSIATRRDVRAISRASRPVVSPSVVRCVCSTVTTSSSAALPARSPMPLTHTSTCLAPARRPATELAVARPRSSWQCTDHTTLFAPDTRERSSRSVSASSAGSAKPTVSGTLIVVAPLSMAAV